MYVFIASGGKLKRIIEAQVFHDKTLFAQIHSKTCSAALFLKIERSGPLHI